MNSKKPLYILAGITFLAQLLAIFITIVIVIFGNDWLLVKLYGMPEELAGYKIFPWSIFIQEVTFFCLTLIPLILLLAKVKGLGLRISAIALAIATLAIELINPLIPIIENRLVAMRGTYALAKLSTVNSAVNFMAGGFTKSSLACLFFTCGMCIYVSIKE